MIISRTPFRISFFGGGTDYPAWSRVHGGAVLAASINRYCYLTVRYLPPFHDHRYRIVYSKIENVNAVEEIQHPAVRAILQHLDIRRGVEIHHDGDLPARAGIASSSAFTVGLLNALLALQGRMIGKHELALAGIHVEQNLLRETVGVQDQVTTAYGGFNHLEFHPSGEISVRPVTIGKARTTELTDRLMMFYTRIKRPAASVAATYYDDMVKKTHEMQVLRQMVDEAMKTLTGTGDLDPFGHLLHESWQLKRGLGKAVSTPEIDAIYARARAAGALGGKVAGAGGGGFMLFFVPAGRQQAVCAALPELLHVPMGFEYGGSQIIFYDTEDGASAGSRHAQPA